jgi:MFS family permease
MGGRATGTPSTSDGPDGVASRVGGRRRGEQVAVSVLFTLLGFLFGAWVSRIPTVADRVHAGPGLLGLVLLGIAAGSVTTMPFAGRLCQRRSSTRVAVWFGIAGSLSLPVVGFAAQTGSAAVVALALVLNGALTGGLDVSMNANAVAVIRHVRRPLMPAFHALYSVGGMLGAATGGLAAAAGLHPTVHFGLVGLLGVAATLLVARHLADDPAEPAPPHVDRGPIEAVRAAVRRLDVLLVVLGVITFCSALSEGSMADWTALFLRDVLRTGDGVAAAGYAAFSVAMAVSRFAGSAVLTRWDPARVVSVGCLLAMAGTLVAVTAPVVPLALVGFTAVGVGLSCAVPITFNAAGAHPLGSGPAISLVSTVGYSGFLAGPPLIGTLGQVAGLRFGLGSVAVFCTAGAALAFRWRDALRSHDPSRQE